MPLRSDLLDELQIPDGTTVEEHDLVTDGDVIVGGQSTVEFGVRGHNVIAGERVHVGGQLMVSGDLDIGDDVDIEEGFEANGWIVIRNPMPTIVFLFVYLSHLLRIGEEEAADEVVSEVLSEDGAEGDPVLIPRNGSVSDDAWRVSTPATVGDDCRLHGNLRAERLAVGEDTVVFGSLRAKSDVHVGTGTEIKGDVTTRDGTVSVGPDVTIWGDISATDVALHEDATVEGSIRARGEMTMLQSDAGTGAPEEDDSATEQTAPAADDSAAEGTGDSADESGDDDSAGDTERVTAPEEDDADAERVTATDSEGERVTASEDGSETDDDYRENGHEAGLAE